MKYNNETCNKFVADMEAAGYAVEHYRGRWFWEGPAVRTSRDQGIDEQDVIRATAVKLQRDNMGLDWILYPKASGNLIEPKEKIMRKRVSRKMASTGCSVFLVLCIGIKADPVGQMNPFAKMSIQQIEREFDVKFVAALPSGTGTPATGTITLPPASGGMNQIPWNPSAISWVFEEKYPLARLHTLDIPLRIEIWESPSYMEFSAAQLAVDHEARYLSDHNLLLVSPPVQESKADPQQIAEWCAGPKPAEDEQHRIANGWETLMSQWGQEIRDDCPDLHFVRAKPVTLIFRYDIHVWCWAADYVVGLKNNRWVPNPNSPNVKDATDLVMDALIYVRQGTIFDTQLNFDGLRDAKGNYPGL